MKDTDFVQELCNDMVVTCRRRWMPANPDTVSMAFAQKAEKRKIMNEWQCDLKVVLVRTFRRIVTRRGRSRILKWSGHTESGHLHTPRRTLWNPFYKVRRNRMEDNLSQNCDATFKKEVALMRWWASAKTRSSKRGGFDWVGCDRPDVR